MDRADENFKIRPLLISGNISNVLSVFNVSEKKKKKDKLVFGVPRRREFWTRCYFSVKKSHVLLHSLSFFLAMLQLNHSPLI